MKTFKTNYKQPEELPRERFKNAGIEALSLRELFALLLGTGTPKQNVFILSEKICRALGADDKNSNLWRVMSTENVPALLKPLKGIGPAKICRLMAALEIAHRMAGEAIAEAQNLRTPRLKEESLELRMLKKVPPRMRLATREWMGAVYLTRHGELSDLLVLARGNIDSISVDLTSILLPLLTQRPLAIGFFHNHPAGTLAASTSDYDSAALLTNIFKLCQVKHVSHWIVTKHGQLQFG